MAEREDPPTDMVLIMGVTGAGKSYFINKLKEDAVIEGDGLESSKQVSPIIYDHQC
jgi:predicted GTPase